MLMRINWPIVGLILAIVGLMAFVLRLQDRGNEELAQTETLSINNEPKIESQPASVEEIAERTKNSESEGSAEVSESNIPAVYMEVLDLPMPGRLSVFDRHAQFLLEPRDETWASAMESGIRNYLAYDASDIDFVVEYVECRSQQCEMAGYVPAGKRDDTDKLKNDLRNYDWWLDNISTSSRGREIEGVERIVIIFSRN